MIAISSFAIVAFNLLLLLGINPSGPVVAAPVPETDTATSYWVANIARQGTIAFGSDSADPPAGGYTIYRDVTHYGATGNGNTDDTAAINAAITDGSRCGQGCDSTTVTPAIIYFPPGEYLVSSPIIQLYYTQFIGDALNPPTIKAAASFQGIAVIDSDPYDNTGNNWYTNQNNFFRQIRNFKIDLTGMPVTSGAGIHWQVAQATSLQNIVFNMRTDGGASNVQQGIFMDNGSGGFMTDLVFNGGHYGAFLGNQQFTTRNLTFNNCQTAIFMNWNWAWTFKSVTINNCGVGIDMANGGPSDQTVGSVLVLDSTFTNTPVGINASFTSNSQPATGGTLIVDNTKFQNCATGGVVSNGDVLVDGNTDVASFAQGNEYVGAQKTRVQNTLASASPSKPATLLASDGSIFERSKPQYEGYAASSFVSVKSKGAAGDGVTDDTAAIQSAINSLTADQILYFDHGAYLVTDTIAIPGDKAYKITGEIWPLIMASGSKFQDALNPVAVFQVGTAGDTNGVEMSDLIFETKGPAPGAILVQWNTNPSQGNGGMWDVHFRIGGSAGTELQSDTCSKNPDSTHGVKSSCEGAGLLFHATKDASVYVENCWFWVADHELDLGDHNQIDIYNGRGVLIESQNPSWWYGTSSEHSVLFNYQIANAKDVFMGLIQSETPYFQPNPDAASTPYTALDRFSDPTFNTSSSASGVRDAWGLRIVSSQDVLVYGAGLYSFFDNYGQDCLDTESCQTNMVGVDSGSSSIWLFGLSTKAAVNMVTVDGVSQALDADNRDNFCATLALWTDA
ncbi:glycoside hydrolase family 55 protein [Saccharata proteae CBS 121410]|uniref:Glycoside hydrolase family 55 protein n=1 Tax=Saccharata proteae CBS 121410 TaxID=1314787 RepID=A0A9P4LYE8_9PEZI|nr:glycoside hydrolase family 55 protein [Saccharata proteae CBS 121410]